MEKCYHEHSAETDAQFAIYDSAECEYSIHDNKLQARVAKGQNG